MHALEHARTAAGMSKLKYHGKWSFRRVFGAHGTYMHWYLKQHLFFCVYTLCREYLAQVASDPRRRSRLVAQKAAVT
jgi:hypothetical protein